jgi:hypothetical protein
VNERERKRKHSKQYQSMGDKAADDYRTVSQHLITRGHAAQGSHGRIAHLHHTHTHTYAHT